MLATMNAPSPMDTLGPNKDSGEMERRREPRVRVDIAARVKSLSPLTSTGPATRARIVEISYHGMKLRLAKELMVGGLVQIIVSGKILMGTVRHVQHRDTEFEVGVRLTERIPTSMG